MQKVVKLLLIVGLVYLFAEFIAIPLINFIAALFIIFYWVILGKK